VDVQSLWEGYLAISRDQRPVDYDVCYPQVLIDSLAQRTIRGCQTVGVRSFNDLPDPPPEDIPALLVEAWKRFLASPQTYGEWEQTALEGLWRGLGFGSGGGTKGRD
jgi:hypothetical protein